MKELTIEQKAKAIDVVKQMVADGQISQDVAEKYFPELKESEKSEDEGVCKKLIAFLKQCKAVYGDGFKQFGLDVDDALAWLEKRCEQKPKKCMYSKDNYTDEDRKVLCEGCEEECEFNKKEEPVREDLEQAIDTYLATYFGSEQEKQDWPFLKKMAIHFAEWQKEQLMTKAIDGEVGYWNLRGLSINTDLPRSVSEGDVVKIITIKKE